MCLHLENGNLKDKDILVLALDLADRSSHGAAVKAVLQEFGRVSSSFLLIEYALYHFSQLGENCQRDSCLWCLIQRDPGTGGALVGQGCHLDFLISGSWT